MSAVIERYCCTKQLCGYALVSEVDSNSEWKWIGFRLVKRPCNDREFQARKSSMCLHQLMMSIVHAVVDPWHRGGKTQYNKWIAVAIHNQSKKDQILKDVQKLIMSQAYFTGQASEPKEASKWRCGTIKEAYFGTLHLSEIVIRQAKVISPYFGVFTLGKV